METLQLRCLGQCIPPSPSLGAGTLGASMCPARGKVQGTRCSHSQPLFLNGSTVPGGLADFSLSGLFSRSVLKVQTTCFEAITKQRQPVRKQPPQRAWEGKLELKKSSAREGTAAEQMVQRELPAKSCYCSPL